MSRIIVLCTFDDIWLLCNTVQVVYIQARPKKCLCLLKTFPFITWLLFLSWTSIPWHVLAIGTLPTIFTNASLASTKPFAFPSRMCSYSIDVPRIPPVPQYSLNFTSMITHVCMSIIKHDMYLQLFYMLICCTCRFLDSKNLFLCCVDNLNIINLTTVWYT